VTTTLAESPIGAPQILIEVRGERVLRRRLMELGLVPGVTVTVQRVAPLGDPLELRVRGSNLSIRLLEADGLLVRPAGEEGSA
jgi:Fe2+ transport system protein FeoA